MDYEQFLEYVSQDLKEHFPNIDVQILSVEKLQRKSYTGLSLTPAGSNAGATLDLQSEFEFVQGSPLPVNSVLPRIEIIAEKALSQIPQVDPMTLQNYDQMKQTLVMQAVPIEPNRALLETVPHRELEDIAIVYRFQLRHNENGDATVLVTNQMLQNYGITPDRLIADAETFAPQRNPVSIRSLADVLAEMSGGMFSPEEVGGPPLLVASVPGLVNGAGILGYPDFFKEAADQIGGSFYVLPSSIHEVLLFADDGSRSAQELSAMVSAVNSQEVLPEDQLGYEAYHYDAQAQIFEKASAYENRVMGNLEMIADAMPGVVREEASAYEAGSAPETISVLMVEPNKYPRQIEIGTDLEDLQKSVGGMIEVIYPYDEPVALIMNEEGKINGLPLNRALRDDNGNIYDVVAGPFMVAGLTEESFGSLSPEQIRKYSEIFKQPEMFMRMGKGIMALPLPDDKIEKANKTPSNEIQKTENKIKHRKPLDRDSR